LSQLERGTLTLHVEPLDLGTLVRDVLAGERRLFVDAQLRLAEALPLQPVPIEGDPERLRQVVIHLVRNATRFTPAGGEVGVAVVPHPATVDLRVSDSGPGLPASLLPHLFTPFTQGPNAHGGLGVGLAVTRGLVTLHRGTVEAIAHGERGGATVVVTLPGGAAPRYATGT
jgi:signal transduction histidine kinase